MCPAVFSTRKELRLHVAAAPHNKLKVVCPWCITGEHTSNRMADLKKHVITKHPGVELAVPADFFSEANGFYLALFPADYARVVHPGPSTCNTAAVTMQAIRLWFNGVSSPSRTLKDWEAGWNLGDATPLREEIGHCPTSPRPAAQVPPYSPSRPEMVVSPLSVSQLVEHEHNVELDVIMDQSTFIVTLSSSLRKSAFMDQLRKQVDAQRPRPSGQLVEVKGSTFEDMASKISRTLGISEVFIDQLQCVRPVPGRLPMPFPTCPPSQQSISSQPPTPARTPAAVSPARPEHQARNLLSWGMMPLLPPCRRNWDADEAVTLVGRRNSIKWPPAGWRTFSAERRLQVFEFATCLLDADLTGYPVTAKGDILDKFNFMALPGSLPPQAGSKSAMRLANYQQLRAIALGEEHDLRMLKMFQNASRDRDSDMDHLIQVVDAAGIQLRLEK